MELFRHEFDRLLRALLAWTVQATGTTVVRHWLR